MNEQKQTRRGDTDAENGCGIIFDTAIAAQKTKEGQ